MSTAVAAAAAAPKPAANKPTQTFKQRLPVFVGYFIFGCVSTAFIHLIFSKVPTSATSWIVEDPTNIIVSLALYLAFVLVFGPWWVKRCQEKGLSAGYKAFWQKIMVYWNLILTLASWAFAVSISFDFLTWIIRVRPTSYMHLICAPQDNVWQGTTWYSFFFFLMSKYAELFDTVIIIARGRMPRFLHWYHHVSVLVYSYFCAVFRFPLGSYFGMVNSFVHSIMYDYYMMQGHGVRLTYDKNITQIQISQMIIGIGLTISYAFYFFYHYEDCIIPNSHPEIMLVASCALYLSYFLLFLQFYIQRYLKGSSQPKETKVAKAE